RGIGLRHLLGARIVRDAAATCLPFSALGGIVIGMRATCQREHGGHHAVAWPEAASANVVDITTEVLGQIVFVLLGVVCLIGHQGSDRFVGPVVIGAVLLAFGIAGFIWTQQSGGTAMRRLARFLGRNIATQWQHTMLDGMGTLQERLEDMWSHPGRIAGAAALHLVAWIGSAATIWVAYRFLGAHLSLTNAIAIEGVTCGIMSASFLVPASLGVQEAAYMALGAAFGIDPSLSMGLSLLRRGRDLVIGVPALLIWQIGEMRRMRYRRTLERQQDYADPAMSKSSAS
ncbi:lysylphosphatidylglycerol synthase domain-containing protein, partial [Ameyamaea chiangmaiensis]